jgi:hypothetical protein
MMNRKLTFSKLMILLISPMLLWSCGDTAASGPAKIQVSLVDSPADYDEVNIEIVDVQVNGSTKAENGWVSLGSAQLGSFDLLKLTNGEEAFLGEVELPAGNLSQIRLILGSENNLVIGTTTYDLTTPSASQSGLKLNVNSEISSGITYKLIIDFDAAKSIVESGNSGKYILKPVLRAAFEATTGAIAGVVSPLAAEAVVYAIQGSDSMASYPDEAGGFLIRALPAGTYDVVAVPADTAVYTAIGMNDIFVETGLVTTIDSLIFD